MNLCASPTKKVYTDKKRAPSFIKARRNDWSHEVRKVSKYTGKYKFLLVLTIILIQLEPNKHKSIYKWRSLYTDAFQA